MSDDANGDAASPQGRAGSLRRAMQSKATTDAEREAIREAERGAGVGGASGSREPASPEPSADAEREAAASAEPMTERPSFSMGASHVRFLDALAWKAGPDAKVSRSEIVRAVVRGMMDAADAGAEIPADPDALRSWVARRLASGD
jgi:Arc/MetJ-type ribon-helix-helix transcriptional regulator